MSDEYWGIRPAPDANHCCPEWTSCDCEERSDNGGSNES